LQEGTQFVRIFIFKSETRPDLQAFAGDEAGRKLPERHGPWTATAIVGTMGALPHNISRSTVETAIGTHGFQLWRKTRTAEENV
jgi:hypothetical protein